MTGLGDDQRRLDGLEIAHFADQDDVGVLPQHVLQRLGEAVRVGEHLALVDHRVLVLVHELDRVLDGDDVLGARVIDLVDHRRERRRLAAAGRAGDAIQDAEMRTPTGTLRITVSIGAAGRRAGMAALDAVLAEADAALYGVKSTGRNRVDGPPHEAKPAG